MNSSRWLVGLGTLLAVCAVGAGVWVGKAVSGLRGEVAALRSELGTVHREYKVEFSDLLGRVTQGANGAVPAAGSEEGLVDPLTDVEFKNASDIKSRVDAMSGVWKSQTTTKVGRIEDLARLLVEMDEWLFVPEERIKADSIIAKEVHLLRDWIEQEVAILSKAAIDAKNGKQAAKILVQINRILNLYPTPWNAAEQAALEKITSNILSTSRRVGEIQYLRYNQWAISQIEDGLKQYRNALAIPSIQDIKKLVTTDREKLSAAAITTMGKIDAAFLNPAAMDLYSYTYALYRDAMGSDDEWRVKLAKGFAIPSNKRLTPADF